MPNTTPACPQCTLENTYPDGTNFVCADCGHEWPMAATAAADD
jgi:protein PhnA